jgi:dipeptidyl aminopeptidase/acylaminoacyl peptidase
MHAGSTRRLAGAAAAVVAVATAVLTATLPMAAQQAAAPAAVDASDYARAERMLAPAVNPLVLHAGVRPAFLPDGRFWYRTTTENGDQAFLVDPATGARAPCDLPACSRGAGGRGQNQSAGQQRTRPEIVSPDGSRAAFIRDWNLWVRDTNGGAETQLTTDGVEDFGYATDNAGWTRSDRPILVWSPDSTKIATFQQDQREVGEMYLVNTTVGHPELQAWKYPLPGDEHVSMIHRVVIDVPTRRVVRFRMEPDQHRSTLCDHLVCHGSEWEDVQWAPDSRTVAFASTSRDHKVTTLRVADAATGDVRDVLEEKVDTFFESGNGRVNWRYLPGSNEVIWFSERDDWGQLYLYDLRNGRLKRQITSGTGNVTQLLRVDEARRMLYFLAVGREQGRDPYYTHFYSVGMDGGTPRLLTPENATHDISLPEKGDYFVDSYSTPEVPPVTVLRTLTGDLVATLERADISRLKAAGWQAPMPITVKARDGKTDLYGLMYRPPSLDPTRKYPIVNHIYPGPQTGSVGSRTFAAARGDSQALAELGFIVVEIDGMGTPWRSKSFHEAYFGDMGDNTLPDQVAGMQELARRYPYIDLAWAGIWGHSGGG